MKNKTSKTALYGKIKERWERQGWMDNWKAYAKYR